MDIAMENLPLDPARRELEIVERKGVGHPDSLCDRAAEAFSRRLSREYLERAGRILHHNVDKALLCAGQTRVEYGGGEWLAPVVVTMAGRATTAWGETQIPVDRIARAAVDEAIRPVRNLPTGQVEVHVEVRPSASELLDLFDRGSGASPRANDTSIGVGFAPLTSSEALALELESRLNAPETKSRVPAIGEDVKIMVVRRGSALRLTVAAAMVSRFVADSEAYRRAVGAVRDLCAGAVREAGFGEVQIDVNAADEIGRSEYLTLSGTSAEAGDDGQVGRGNRLSGLITPMRPMVLEAYAGKNPVTHVGKLYSVSAARVAAACAKLSGVRAAECFMVSEIGRPITEPQSVGIRLDAGPDAFAKLDGPVRTIVERETAALPHLWRNLVQS
ncbi:MAG: methionine adenosyltransferase [Deltaproteobacteria bacterium]|nr:MAG: methionine adenosyltransferase [Deltaproteobacteria bacterium]